MSFKVLSHASMQVNYQNDSLLIDPWLVGSCYWRSWWNYPPVKSEALENLKPTAIYITHVHWDHWHCPSLKQFLNQDVEIITHDEPNKRSLRDLQEFGFKKIKILKHGESYNIGGIKITPYQFGLFLNDSAVVIETPEVKILNANDCKIAGASLEQIKNSHGQFDFALRSHSSANDRICYKIEGSDFLNDDPSHYTRAFKLFMDNVKPKYAIPFASNHCHLHKDVFSFNNFINDPYKLKNEIQTMGGLTDSKIKIMMSGDSWSRERGFIIDSSLQEFFDNKSEKLNKYQEDSSSTLESYYELESKTRINKRTIALYQKQLGYIPKFLMKNLKDWSFGLKLFGGKKDYYLHVKPYDGIVNDIDEDSFRDLGAKILMPAIVFNSAVNQNMFHHSGISKRNQYIFKDEENLRKWSKLNNLLNKVELEVFPLSFGYFIRLVKNYSLRWREILVYFKAFILMRKGLKNYDVEEIILTQKK